jgi:hypothetical protein
VDQSDLEPSPGGEPPRELTRKQTILAFLIGGWFFFMIVFVGSDLYSFGRLPPTNELLRYFLLAVALSPLGALVVGLKGGWIQEYLGLGRVLVFLLAVVFLGIIAAFMVKMASM